MTGDGCYYPRKSVSTKTTSCINRAPVTPRVVSRETSEKGVEHIIGFSEWVDTISNKEVCAKIQQAIGACKDLLTIVKRCRLQWYGHFSRSSGQAKTILQGTVKGGRRQGRQKKRWEDNIREWTGLEFTQSQRAVENREKWRNLVAKLWCPNDLMVKG